jgi:hypothetical protein
MKARVSQLCKTEAEWAVLHDFVPLNGEVIILARINSMSMPEQKSATVKLN